MHSFLFLYIMKKECKKFDTPVKRRLEWGICMGTDIFEQFPDRESFERYWKENYTPVTYEDIRDIYENYVNSAAGHIFLSDYEEGGCISKADFKDNLSQEAQFMFEDGLTEVFYDKNPALYEAAFALYEAAEMAGEGAQRAQIFHTVFKGLYETFLDRLFDELIAGRQI